MLLILAPPSGAFAQDTSPPRPEVKINRDRKARLNPVAKDKAKKAAKDTAADEDAQIIENLDLLQNLELLQDYEKVNLINLLAPDKQKPPTRTKNTKEQKKGQRSDEKSSIN